MRKRKDVLQKRGNAWGNEKETSEGRREMGMGR